VQKALRMLTALVAAVGLLVLGVVSAEAKTSGAHFMPDTAASVADNGALSVFIDEAGVGQQNVDYTLTWTATADYGCINGGGNHPQATNKATTSTGGADTFSESPINGRIMTTVSVPGTPPPPPSGFSCPSGQTLVLADVTYSATLADTTNNASTTLSASRTFFTFKK
jgi:hypothetical protein